MEASSSSSTKGRDVRAALQLRALPESEGLDETYTDAFGKVHTVQQREDAQLQKFFLPFSGWFLTPKFRYYLYVWSSNASQGDPAQVVGGGNISYVFNKYVTFGAVSRASRACAAPKDSFHTGSAWTIA
jgi:hypothetical protein